MDLEEYNKVKNMNYDEYCLYLQNKYGKAKGYYCTPKGNKHNIGRTSEGLVIHHVKEDEMIMLSNPTFARLAPYEFQSPDNLVYCNYLEHLLLHVLIVEKSVENAEVMPFGLGGIMFFLVPELNDWYSGYYKNSSKEGWRRNCYEVVKDNEDTYLEILWRYIDYVDLNSLIIFPANLGQYNPDNLLSSFNESFGLWKSSKNKRIYGKIQALIDKVRQ